MFQPRYDLAALYDSEIFAIGRLPAHSDHAFYRTASEAAADASSLRQSLNGQWKFHYAEGPQSRPQGFFAPDYDVSAWDDITVPGHIQLSGYGRAQYVNVQYPWDGHEQLIPPAIPQDVNPVGSYVRTFDLPAAWNGLRTVLTFHGVETAFFCWVNGQFIGYSEDSFTPAHFDITAALTPGRNTLAVEVFRFSTASWLEDQDFWRFSGIFRDVELTACPEAHLADLFVHADMDGAFRAECKLDLPESGAELEAVLTDAEGRAVLTFSQAAQKELTLAGCVPNAQLWSAETPYLYTLDITLKDQDQVYEVSRTRVGFRRFELKDGLMLLNGKRILFHGADRHEFCMESGRCVSYAHMLADVRAIKRNNINAIRTSHYPNQTAWYRLCDEYGIYLIDETNLETHGTWSDASQRDHAVPGSDPVWLPAVLDRAQSMLERDKNHPSVLIWSCGNESFGGKDIFEMSQFFRQRDPSRLVHYEGVFNDRSYNATSDMESQMYTPAADILKFLDEHPEKPFILCEYTHAMGNSCGGMFKYIQLEDINPRYQGGFIWDFVDQALQTTAPNGKPRLAYGGDFGDRPTDRDFCGNGLLFADRTETPRMQEVKFLYQPIRLFPDAKGVRVENRSLFLNADQYDLCWCLNRDGVTIQLDVIEKPDVPAGETRRFDLPLMPIDQPGEYVLHCALCLRESCSWAEAGYKLMHGESIVARIAREAAAPAADYTVSKGLSNIGARSDAYEALFSLVEGGLCSFHAHDGLERIITAPALNLYRAPTNNDIGNRDYVAEGLWLVVSQLSRFEPVSAAMEGGLLTVRYRAKLPLADTEMALSYTVLGNGRVKVELSWPGKDNLPDMEAFGLSIRLPRELCNVSYYGCGPEENYIDRMQGAELGLHNYTVQGNLTPYLQPQECGNREGVRRLAVTDQQNRGLLVEMADAPLSVSVLPHSVSELMAARHQDELAEPTYTYLDVALYRKGVGGDNTWGAPVHPEFHLPARQPRRLSFILSVVK